jgi:hypothetical protein
VLAPLLCPQVDVANNRGLVKRFSLSTTPAVLLFRDRGMYSVSLAGVRSPDADKLAAAVTAFIEGGYEQQVRCTSPWWYQQWQPQWLWDCVTPSLKWQHLLQKQQCLLQR